MSEASVEAIAAVLRGQQSSLTARLRGPETSLLAARMIKAGAHAGLTSLIAAAPRVISALREAHAAAQRRLAIVEAEVHAASDAAGRRQALARVIRREVRDRGRRRGDLRALRRDLDLEAIRERFAGELDELETQIELALALVGNATPVALASEPTAGATLRRAGLAALLCTQSAPGAGWRPRFTLRLAAVEGLQRVCDALGPADPDAAIAAAMTARVYDPDEHPWVQAAALAVLACVAPAAGSRLCAAILRAPHVEDLSVETGDGRSEELSEKPGERGDAPVAIAGEIGDARPVDLSLEPGDGRFHGPRAFLLRRLVIDWLAAQAPGRRGEEAIELLARSALRGDPSEHVRVGLARAAGGLAQEPRAVRMLAALADPLRETSATVRAAALQAAAGGPAGELLLQRSLSEETSTLVLQVACAAAAEQGGAAVTAALLRLAARDDRPHLVHEAAAAALEAIDRREDPARAAWTAALAETLAAIPPGGARHFSLRRPELPPPGGARWFGRILAELTRDDWGVDVDLRPDRLVLRRGDRWRARLWRLLHELRTPSPNKRQAHAHTRGRVLRGALRAHSGRLHEVTATGVPGEPVHCEREGGWGRHLPPVDDLLGLPIARARPVQIFSSHGVTTLRWRVGLLARVGARARLQLHYAWLAALRQDCLASGEPAQRGRYALTVHDHFGVELRFTPHPPPGLSRRTGDMAQGTDEIALRNLPLQLRALFPVRGAGPRPPVAESSTANASLLLAPELLDWLWLHAPYFISVSANSQQALALFLAGLAALGLCAAYLRSRGMARDRAAIPLVIGGWGTRGKSGTERLKAGLLHGLGHRVFAKTTGCEAMFIHAPPGGPPREIYTFRPYGKATIWEQRTLLRLATELRSEVFLWECMALSPAYVQILQRAWMRDDLATITNAYPDHEDIQGPAGVDVAGVIAGFVPTASTLVTSEQNFLPLLRSEARRQRTRVVELPALAGELLPADLLALFPYEEHPRNVALVAAVAVELGLDPTLAIVTMAEHVVPDLGVLKRFGPARVRGRLLEFINGCSANERTGFLSNWRRTGCDALDLAREPDRYLITVVNNRDDRVSRSQVFARVLVEDAAADRHVIIGTNTHGLLGYVRDALDEFLAREVVVRPEDLALGTAGSAAAHARLDALLARLRVVPGEPAALAGQLEIFARGAGRELPPATLAATAERCAPWLADDGDPGLAATLVAVQAELAAWVEAAVLAAPTLPERSVADPPEVDEPASPASVAAHFVRQLARAAIACRLRARLTRALAAGEPALPGFHAELRAAYRELFLELVEVVEDPASSGDQVVLRCALAVPPGVRVAAMGTQNIKGTGLDFVYRWIALDAASVALAQLRARDPQIRRAALLRLESPDDPGLLDAGLVAHALAIRRPGPGEAELQARAQARAHERHTARRAALATRHRRGRSEALLGWLEGLVDFLDGARRHARAREVMRDLVRQRISHARAAQAMRELDARAKGGWLAKSLRRR